VSNNGKPVSVRMQTKDELIDALRDQCKFWRRMWSESVDMNLALEARVAESIKQLGEIKKHLNEINEVR